MGGKAFEGITKRIHQSDIEPTLKWLTSKWSGAKIQGGNYMDHLLGSSGKNATSGDLDLNMQIELYNQSAVADELRSLLGEDKVKARPGNNQIFTAVPLHGNPNLGYVQVDFMFGDYEWQKFSYYSAKLDPELGSRHSWRRNYHCSGVKGLYRTELLKSLVAFNSDWVLEENGEMIARVGPTFFHDRGCVWRYRHRPMRKDGTARVKDLKELSKEEFMKIYPSATPARAEVIKDPNLVVQMVLSENCKEEWANTFESLWLTVQNLYNTEQQKTITKIYLERLNSLKAEIPVDIFRAYRLKV